MKLDRFVPASALVAVAVLVGAGCGGSADDEAGGTGDDTAELAQYCDKSVEIERVFAREFPAVFEASPEDQPAAVKKVAGAVLPVAQSASEIAPSEIAADVETLLGVLREAAETGDGSGFDEPETEATDLRVHAYEVANCDWERTDVTATEYSFAGIPSTAPAGVRSFELSNKGSELHELSVLRINDDVTVPLADLLALPQEEAMTKVQSVGLGFANPEKTNYAVVDLQPGRYAVVCFIPVGLTPAVAEAAEKGEGPPPDGPPHAARGMAVELKVA